MALLTEMETAQVEMKNEMKTDEEEMKAEVKAVQEQLRIDTSTAQEETKIDMTTVLQKVEEKMIKRKKKWKRNCCNTDGNWRNYEKMEHNVNTKQKEMEEKMEMINTRLDER